ncbi:MAG: M48 family metalloprotease [Rhodospirillales bacterium]|nr:M48 family metalloprotease [Rhodospirillales bacterium]
MRLLFKSVLVLILALSLTLPGSVRAQSISLIRDTEIETTIRAYATPVFLAAGLDPSAVRIYLVNDKQINAFVAGGQNLFINAGLLLRSEDAGQVIGVIAHETGHIAGGHLIRLQEALKRGTAESILAFVLGAAAAAAGRPDVGAAVISGGQNIALRNLLQYSRTQEGAADAAAMKLLDETEQSAEGLLRFLNILSEQELLSPTRQDPYLRTHPLSADRIQALAAFVSRSPHSNVPVNPVLQRQHERMVVKLRAFLEEPGATLRRYPETDTSDDALYARAVAAHRSADSKKAIQLIDALLAKHPQDPYYHELKGQILFEGGQPREAIDSYSTAARLLPAAPLIRLDLARAQLGTNDPSLLNDAITNLRVSLAEEPNRPFVWRQLAIALGRDGQQAESSLALAEEAILLNKMPEARFHASKAERLLPAGSPGWLKAQDIITAVDLARD